MYALAIQKTNAGKFRVCLVQTINSKLVLQGEPINRMVDALNIANGVRDGWDDKRDRMEPGPIEVLPATHKWPKNAGPRKAKKRK